MRCLVTGSNGFIGSHLVERLLEEGHYVIGIDDFSTGRPENLKPHSNLVVVQASILDPIDTFFEDIDWVFHLAALTRPQWSIEHPVEADITNVQGTLKVFKHAKENNIKRVVFTSSSSLYGIQEVFPTKEEVIPHPMSPYGLQKLMGEMYAKLYETMYGLQVNCIRPFNVYGTRQNFRGGYAAAVPKFINSLSKDEECCITGDGTQSRDFTYVDDLVDILYRAAYSPVYGESFNAGGGKTVSINDLYMMIRSLMKKDLEPRYIDAVYEPHMTLADTTKAQKLLGWTPKVGIEEGLKRTVEGTLKK